MKKLYLITGFLITSFFLTQIMYGQNEGTVYYPGDLKMQSEKTLGMEDFYRDPPDVSQCKEGFLKESEIQKVLDLVNYIRSLHDLPAVTYHYEDDPASAKAALMMAAQGTISHTPPSSFACYTELGRSVTEKSNLHINMYGSPNPSNIASCESGIRGWLFDNYSGNPEKVGHRRAIINPFLKYFSFGRCDGKPKASSQWPYVTTMTFKFNNDEVQNLNNWDDEFVAYPYHEYPSELFLKDFFLSFSFFHDKQRWFQNNVDFSEAIIEMKDEDGNPVTVHSKYSDNEGWGAVVNCLVWKADNLVDNVRYNVKISNVKAGGQTRDFEYWFKLGDAAPPALDSPKLLSPENNAQNLGSTVKFKWSEVDEATKYHLQVADNGTFNSPFVDADEIPATEYEVENLKKNETYYWRVLAYNDKQKSLFSDIWLFRTEKDSEKPDPPMLLMPADNDIELSLTPIFSWGSTPQADGYYFQLAADDSFGEEYLVINEDLSSNAYKVPSDKKLQGGVEYFWRVKAYGSFGETDWTEIRSFTTTGTSVEEYSAGGFSIENVPNPAGSETDFIIYSPENTYASLIIYSKTGAEILSENIELTQGSNIFRFNLNELPHGVFFYVLQTGKTTLYNKLIIVR